MHACIGFGRGELHQCMERHVKRQAWANPGDQRSQARCPGSSSVRCQALADSLYTRVNTTPPQPEVGSVPTHDSVSRAGGTNPTRCMDQELAMPPCSTASPSDVDGSATAPTGARLIPHVSSARRGTGTHCLWHRPLGGNFHRSTWSLDGTCSLGPNRIIGTWPPVLRFLAARASSLGWT